MSDTLITVDHISKKFCRDLKTSLWYGLKDITSEMTGRKKTEHSNLRDKEFWALKDLSFEVKRGECLGLIGRNGAGKSTILKILNGLIKPDTGKVEIFGSVGALIELSAGFNPILTGRENIYNSAAIRGFSKKETDKKLYSIIEFSELKDFIDTPVQYYSSGMRLRLGFTIASHMEPDILLLDEVLAVGDMGFALKCFNKMDELLQNTAMVFVSHSMPQISRMCSKVIDLKNGRSVSESYDVQKGISFYYDQYELEKGSILKTEHAELESIYLSSEQHETNPSELFEMNQGDDFQVHLRIKLFKPVINPHIFLNFLDKEQTPFAEVYNFRECIPVETLENSFHIVASFSDVQFTQGIYSIQVGFFEESEKGRRHLFRIQSAVYFKVQSNRHAWVPIQFKPKWELR